MRGRFTEEVSFVQCEDRAIEWLVSYGLRDDAGRSLQPGEYLGRRRGALEEQRGRLL